jgi:hypothetical protein
LVVVCTLLFRQRSDRLYCAPYCLVRGMIGSHMHPTV